MLSIPVLFWIHVAGLTVSAKASDSPSIKEAIVRIGTTMTQTIVSELETALKDEVCYHRLGCFNNTSPWRSLTRPLPAPQPPEQVRTRLYFYSRDTDNYTQILLDPEVDLNGAKLNKNRKTYIITHGLFGYGDSRWTTEIREGLLSREDVNVIIVDWNKGSQQLDALQASSDVRIVARETYRFLKETNVLDLGTLHLIGHSLGAHVMGEVGRLFEGKIGRITGLDTAQPFFEGYDPLVHLDITDAVFVDTVHTSARYFIPFLGLGFVKPVGHIDFYMNNGKYQPGCIGIIDSEDLAEVHSFEDFLNLPSALFETTFCSHSRSFKYFVEAVANPDCVFWGRKVTNIQTFLKSNATEIDATTSPCDITTCVPLGLNTLDSSLRGVFKVVTNALAPFCISQQ